MKITEKEIKEFAKKFLTVLDRGGIVSTEDLENKLESKFTIDKQPQDFISLTLRPSFGISTYTLSYTRPDLGIPIELIINSFLNYSQIILKVQDNIKGYSQFNTDIYDNIIQNKVILSSDLKLARKELEDLSKLVL